jgi:hypothetical protein
MVAAQESHMTLVKNDIATQLALPGIVTATSLQLPEDITYKDA